VRRDAGIVHEPGGVHPSPVQGYFKTSPSTLPRGGEARGHMFDAMNTEHAAVTWLSTVGIESIRVRRFARGWRPCNGGWDEVGRR
jgi:hypothetical protein